MRLSSHSAQPLEARLMLKPNGSCSMCFDVRERSPQYRVYQSSTIEPNAARCGYETLYSLSATYTDGVIRWSDDPARALRGASLLPLFHSRRFEPALVSPYTPTRAARLCSPAWYEERTSGPASTCRKPRRWPSSVERGELVGVPVALHRQVLRRRAQVLADREQVAVVLAQVGHRLRRPPRTSRRGRP